MILISPQLFVLRLVDDGNINQSGNEVLVKCWLMYEQKGRYKRVLTVWNSLSQFT